MARKILILFTLLFCLYPLFLTPHFNSMLSDEILSIQNYNKSSRFEWKQVVDKGFGNVNNLHAWAMEEYKGFLYVGTRNIIDGCQIYRSDTGDKNTWIKVNHDGFSRDSKSEGARHMIVYANLLWVITVSWQYGTQVWVTDGKDLDNDGIINWKKANNNGFGQGNIIFESRGIAIFEEKLYVGCGSKNNHPLLFRYDGLTDFTKINPEMWTLVKDWYKDPYYNPDLFLVGELCNFTGLDGNNYLYASVITGVTPLVRKLYENFSFLNFFKTFKTLLSCKGQIWRYDSNNWEQVANEVFITTNLMGSTFIVLNESLYIGTANWLGGEIWRTNDGISWEQILKRGFYSPFNFWIWKLFIYNNRIIAGTLNPVFGCEIWMSVNDLPLSFRDFIKINKNGMDGTNIFASGELTQDGARSFEIFNDTLYVGTTNWISLIFNLKGNGCEIWRIKKG